MEPIRLFFALNVGCTLTHYAPTWLRAYGDREERRRNRCAVWLFPPAVVVLAAATWERQTVLAFVLYAWDRFHAVMQNYGFARLYDAKHAGAPARWRRLDLAWLTAMAAMLTAWNMGLLVPLLEQLERVGIPIAHRRAVMTGIRATTTTVAVVITAIWLWDTVRRTRIDGRINSGRLAFLALITAGHGVMNTTTNVFLLGAHEKVYHSVQYCVLVWHYNRKRVAHARPDDVSPLLRWTAGPRGLWVYVGVLTLWTSIVFAIDAAWFRPLVGASGNTGLYTALFAALALTHYYFDSFLWRVRRADIRANL
ncbi:MAG: hypothetical protein D6689_09920 [Deltaproteobacteria bacterium]|nr:MAG: hypothetical protein D6689_09920 [Deltaproteobacteria bacterium]